MGKPYYCDYCDKKFVGVHDSILKHRKGLSHRNHLNDYYLKYRDKRQILAEESTKNPCNRFLYSNNCSFGSLCKYSHYSHDQLDALRKDVLTKDNEQYDIVPSPSEINGCSDNIQKWFTSRKQRYLNDSQVLKNQFFDTITHNSNANITALMGWKSLEMKNDDRFLPPSLKNLMYDNLKLGDLSEWG